MAPLLWLKLHKRLHTPPIPVHLAPIFSARRIGARKVAESPPIFYYLFLIPSLITVELHNYLGGHLWKEILRCAQNDGLRSAVFSVILNVGCRSEESLATGATSVIQSCVTRRDCLALSLRPLPGHLEQHYRSRYRHVE